jgi:DNA repair photolyase
MLTTLGPLPQALAENTSSAWLSPAAHPPATPRVVLIERHGAVLLPSPLNGDGDILSLNIVRGCSHRCNFCPVTATTDTRGEETIELYRNTPARLDEELACRRIRPRAVFLCPDTDPILPSPEVQAETMQVVAILTRYGIKTWLMTRGTFNADALPLLSAHKHSVKVMIALTTLDHTLHHLLEPGASMPEKRLEQVADLQRQGLEVRVCLEPLIPTLTDTRRNLEPLLKALAQANVRHVTTSYLFLREGIAENLLRALEDQGFDKSALAEYADGPRLGGNGLAPASYLPRSRRQRGYASLMALAAEYGIGVSVSGSTNPDFLPPSPTVGPAQSRPSLLAQYLRSTQ